VLRISAGSYQDLKNWILLKLSMGKKKSTCMSVVSKSASSRKLDMALEQCFSTFFASRTTLCNKKILGNTNQNFIITIMMFSSVLALLIY